MIPIAVMDGRTRQVTVAMSENEARALRQNRKVDEDASRRLSEFDRQAKHFDYSASKDIDAERRRAELRRPTASPVVSRKICVESLLVPGQMITAHVPLLSVVDMTSSSSDLNDGGGSGGGGGGGLRVVDWQSARLRSSSTSSLPPIYQAGLTTQPTRSTRSLAASPANPIRRQRLQTLPAAGGKHRLQVDLGVGTALTRSMPCINNATQTPITIPHSTAPAANAGSPVRFPPQLTTPGSPRRRRKVSASPADQSGDLSTSSQDETDSGHSSPLSQRSLSSHLRTPPSRARSSSPVAGASSSRLPHSHSQDLPPLSTSPLVPAQANAPERSTTPQGRRRRPLHTSMPATSAPFTMDTGTGNQPISRGRSRKQSWQPQSPASGRDPPALLSNLSDSDGDGSAPRQRSVSVEIPDIEVLDFSSGQVAVEVVSRMGVVGQIDLSADLDEPVARATSAKQRPLSSGQGESEEDSDQQIANACKASWVRTPNAYKSEDDCLALTNASQVVFGSA